MACCADEWVLGSSLQAGGFLGQGGSGCSKTHIGAVHITHSQSHSCRRESSINKSHSDLSENNKPTDVSSMQDYPQLCSPTRRGVARDFNLFTKLPQCSKIIDIVIFKALYVSQGLHTNVSYVVSQPRAALWFYITAVLGCSITAVLWFSSSAQILWCALHRRSMPHGKKM